MEKITINNSYTATEKNQESESSFANNLRQTYVPQSYVPHRSWSKDCDNSTFTNKQLLKNIQAVGRSIRTPKKVELGLISNKQIESVRKMSREILKEYQLFDISIVENIVNEGTKVLQNLLDTPVALGIRSTTFEQIKMRAE